MKSSYTLEISVYQLVTCKKCKMAVKVHTLIYRRADGERGQTFVYKLHTSYDGCNVLARPLQHFCAKPNCIGDDDGILWCFVVCEL